jgi:hypothetical protein
MAAMIDVPEALAYETFVRSLDDLRLGRKSVLTLRSLAPGRHKYLAANVIARVTEAPSPGGVGLRVRSAVGHAYPGPYYVEIVETLPLLIPGQPYEDAYEALQRTYADRLD